MPIGALTTTRSRRTPGKQVGIRGGVHAPVDVGLTGRPPPAADSRGSRRTRPPPWRRRPGAPLPMTAKCDLPLNAPSATTARPRRLQVRCGQPSPCSRRIRSATGAGSTLPSGARAAEQQAGPRPPRPQRGVHQQPAVARAPRPDTAVCVRGASRPRCPLARSRCGPSAVGGSPDQSATRSSGCSPPRNRAATSEPADVPTTPARCAGPSRSPPPARRAHRGGYASPIEPPAPSTTRPVSRPG